MNRSLKRKTSLILVLAMVLLACGCAGKSPEPEMTQETNVDKKESLETMLVFCVDSYTLPEKTDAYRNGNKAELLALLVMDQEQEKTTVLQLNPDTIVEFTPPGTRERLEIPLGQVFSYGSGGSDSGFAQMKSVSQFLGGITMDHYLMFTMDAVGVVNDFVGGVPLNLTEDIQEEFPENSVGDLVTLNAMQALQYLRFREETDVDSARYMERQRQYMLGLFPRFFQKAGDDDFLTRLTLQIGEGMASDLTLSQMAQMLERLEAYELDKTVHTIDGTAELKNGERYFSPDPASKAQVIEKLFVPST